MTFGIARFRTVETLVRSATETGVTKTPDSIARCFYGDRRCCLAGRDASKTIELSRRKTHNSVAAVTGVVRRGHRYWRFRALAGALSRIKRLATKPTAPVAASNHAGASELPVALISHVMNIWVVPPKIAIEKA